MAGLKDLVNKAIADAGFRRLLSENPAAALAGFELTDEQKSAFMNARGRDLSALLAEMDLDSRVSKTGLPLNPLGGGNTGNDYSNDHSSPDWP